MDTMALEELNKPYKIYAETLEKGVLEQFTNCMMQPSIVQGALMPDAHVGKVAAIGSVLKSKNTVFPSFPGFDLGCGVLCLELDLDYQQVDLQLLKQHILVTIPLGRNGHDIPQTTDVLNFDGVSQMLMDAYSTKGVMQLGTLGSGNHFVELGYTESNNNLAIVIHSGSRGFGHSVATHYMQEAASLSAESNWPATMTAHIDDFTARNKPFQEANPNRFVIAVAKFVAKQKAKYMKKQDIEGAHSLDLQSQLGKQYMIDQNFCLDYAVLNRKRMAQAIVRGILAQLPNDEDIKIKRNINRNHNHAELQIIKHSDSDGTMTDEHYVIHRKGATHAEFGMYGVIPGNMRDGSFIVKGLGNSDSMSSSSHGAGRVLSRRKARETLDLAEFQVETEQLITNHTSEMLDEAPAAYKNIFDVMAQQADLVQVIDRVIPILNIKG